MTATSPTSRRPATSAARAASRAGPASSAPTTSPRAAAMPTARSARSRATSTGSRSSCATPSIRLLDGSSGGGSVATMVPKQDAAARASAKESTGAIKAGRPRVVGGGGSFLPGHLGSTYYAEQLATVPVVNMLLGSVVGIGAAKAVLGPLLGDGARHRPAVRRRPAGGQPRHGLRRHQGGPRRLAHPLPQRLGRQPRRDRGGGDGADPALPVATCRRASTRRRRSPGRDRSRPTAARRSCSPWCRASAPRPSTCAARSG